MFNMISNVCEQVSVSALSTVSTQMGCVSDVVRVCNIEV